MISSKQKLLLVVSGVLALIILATLTYINYSKEGNPLLGNSRDDKVFKLPPDRVDKLETNPTKWKSVFNDKYGYSYKQPPEAFSYNNYRPTGSLYNFSIDPVNSYQSEGKDLKSFAELMWQINKDDDNPNVPNKFISPLKTIDLNGRTSFTFEIDSTFNTNQGGYVLNEKNVYIITDNQRGDLFIIHYPVSDPVAEDILATLKIDANLIAPKLEPAEWTVYSNDINGFSFTYPKNIFPEQNLDLPPNSILGVGGRRGGMGLKIVDHPLDPKNIDNMYGTIHNAEKVKIGNRDGYKTAWGDAGCGDRIFDVPINYNTKTLRISIGSCEDDLYPVFYDQDLQDQILSTFVFTK